MTTSSPGRSLAATARPRWRTLLGALDRFARAAGQGADATGRLPRITPMMARARLASGTGAAPWRLTAAAGAAAPAMLHALPTTTPKPEIGVPPRTTFPSMVLSQPVISVGANAQAGRLPYLSVMVFEPKRLFAAASGKLAPTEVRHGAVAALSSSAARLGSRLMAPVAGYRAFVRRTTSQPQRFPALTEFVGRAGDARPAMGVGRGWLNDAPAATKRTGAAFAGIGERIGNLLRRAGEGLRLGLSQAIPAASAHNAFRVAGTGANGQESSGRRDLSLATRRPALAGSERLLSYRAERDASLPAPTTLRRAAGATALATAFTAVPLAAAVPSAASVYASGGKPVVINYTVNLAGTETEHGEDLRRALRSHAQELAELIERERQKRARTEF